MIQKINTIFYLLLILMQIFKSKKSQLKKEKKLELKESLLLEGGHGHGAKSVHSFAESAEEADLHGLANL
jgi:hypothetical protein